MGEGLSMNCTKCGNEMSAFEVSHMELYHPNEQLCRPCVCYKTSPMPTKAELDNSKETIDRLIKLAEEQNA